MSDLKTFRHKKTGELFKTKRDKVIAMCQASPSWEEVKADKVKADKPAGK